MLNWYYEAQEDGNYLSQEQVASQWNISQAIVSKWIAKKEEIFKKAAKKQYSRGIWANNAVMQKPEVVAMEKQLMEVFKERRKEGRKCSSYYMRKKAREIMEELSPNSDFKASDGWFRKFCIRFNLVNRRKTNVKKESAEERRPRIMAWHKTFRMFLKSPTPEGYTLASAADRAKWGRFQPHHRINFDQVPCPFALDLDSTYEEKGADRVWIRTNGDSSAKKRFCTLQLAFRMKSHKGIHLRQPKPTIIFRGAGKRIKGEERAAHDPRSVCFFSPKHGQTASSPTNGLEINFCPS